MKEVQKIMITCSEWSKECTKLVTLTTDFLEMCWRTDENDGDVNMCFLAECQKVWYFTGDFL